MNDRHSPDSVLRLLFPYALTVLGIALTTHIIIRFVPTHMLTILTVGTALIGILMLALVIAYGKALDRLRFGGAVAHAFTYAVLVGGNLLHLFLLLVFRVGDSRANLEEWFGPTIAMGALWGIGLIIHLLAVIGSRGFEATAKPATVGPANPTASAPGHTA